MLSPQLLLLILYSFTLKIRGIKKGCPFEQPFAAEKEGFEPPIPLGMPVFKTGAINRSAISPRQK